MTIVGSKRMIVYDDVAQQEKIKVFDTRVERPPHYDTFAEFHYAYHYGDMYVPYIKQEEPLKVECQHFVGRTLRRPRQWPRAPSAFQAWTFPGSRGTWHHIPGDG